MAYRDQPLGELALSIPRASALFRKYDMDYCCGGKQTLARAAARKELDVEVIEAELAKLAEQPIEKEEQILFPMIKQGMGSQAMGPISVMESEHDEAGELLEVIKHTTNNVTPPPEACTTWKAMYNGINELIDDLMEHISLENNVLFPRALAGE